MSLYKVILLVFYSLGMACGQLLFKISADRVRRESVSEGFMTALFTDGYFIAAVTLYGLLTVLWVWLLTSVPLSRAYPFIVLAFIFTPALAILVLGESVNGWYFTGLTLVVTGLAVLVAKA